MKAISQFILYLLLGIFILGGFLLFAFNTQVVSYLQNKNDLVFVKPAPLKIIPQRETINPALLKLPRLNTLVNNVVSFNFTNICWHPDTILSQPVTILSTSSTSSKVITGITSASNCVQGNSLPFVLKIK